MEKKNVKYNIQEIAHKEIHLELDLMAYIEEYGSWRG